MEILKFSTPSCGQCRLVAQAMDKNGIKYREIDCTTTEGCLFSADYGITHVPTVIVLDVNGKERDRYNNLPAILKAITAGAFKDRTEYDIPG